LYLFVASALAGSNQRSARQLTTIVADTTSQEDFRSAVAITAWDGIEDGQNHFDQVVKQRAPDGNLQLLQNRPGSGEVAFRNLLQAYVGSKVAGLRNAGGQWIVYQLVMGIIRKSCLSELIWTMRVLMAEAS
jgi:hypothetical protein